MNPTLKTLSCLADSQPPTPKPERIGFEVYAPESDDIVASGHYLVTQARERRVFAQAVGKLLAAGFEVLTWRLPHA